MQSKVQTFRLAGPFWLFFCLLAGPLFSQTSWIGPVGGDWATSANWNNGLPASGNDALIGGGNSVVISAALSTSFGVQNFGTITANAALTIGSGSFENSGTMNFSTTGGLVNSATFKNFGTSTFSGAATFLNSTAANFQNFGPFTLPTTLTNQGSITNDGTIDATNGTILSSGSFQNNQTFTTKTLTVQAGSSYTNNFGSTLNITGAGSSLDASGFMTNNGTLNNVGDFQVNNNVVNNGIINNNVGGTLTIIVGAQLNNSGTVLNKSTLTNNGILTNGNNFFNEGTVTNNSQFNNNNRIENRTGAIFTNNTVANLDNGFGSVLLNIGTFSNKNSMNFFGLLQNDGGFTNDGTINMNTGSTFDNNLNFTNNNILNTQNTAGNDGTLTNNKTINILSGSIFTNRATFTNGLAGKINNQFEFVNNPIGIFNNNGVFTNSIRMFLEGQTTNNGYLVNPGDVFVKIGGTLTNTSVIDQQAGNTSNEGSIVNQNLFLNDDCSTLVNRSGATVNNTGGTIRNRGLIFQRGTFSGNAVTNIGGNIHTGATSASAVLCKNPSITADDDGIVKVYATGLISFANTDSCQNIIYRANGEARPTFGCADIGTVKSVNVVMTTRLGDSLTCVSQVTPTDILAPNFTGCPADLTVYTSANSAAATWTAPTAVDNCSVPTITVDRAPGSSFNVGITAVNYVATDAKNNAQTCQFKVTVIKVPVGAGCAGDVAGPVFNGCPANISVTTTTQFANATWANPTPTDGCQPITLTATHFSGQAFPVGTTVVRFTAKDGNNNTSLCQFSVVVTQTNLCLTDTQKPNFNDCPANITLLPNPNTGSAVAIWSGPSVSDNCAISNLTSNFQSGSIFPTGTTTVIYTATDGSGNTATCNFTVNVGADPCPGDIAGPVFSGCPANISLTTATNAAVANWTAPTVADACTPVVLNANYVPGAAFPLGVTQVIYTASDKKGNKSTCSFSVTVNTVCSTDAVPPVITGCPGNVNVSTTGTSQVATWTAPTATDNCTLVSFTTSYLPGSGFPIGTTNVVYTATDLKGNIATCSFNIIVSTVPTGCASNSAPANNAVQVNPVGLSLNWAAAVGATSYDVYLGTVNPPTTLIASNVVTTSYAPSGLAFNASYFWYVVPKNAVGPLTTCASTATKFNTITSPGCATMSAPANNAVNLLPTAVSLSWAAVSGAVSYDVYLGTANPPTTTVATNVAATTFTTAALTGNTPYFWYVLPKNAAGTAVGCSATPFKFTTGILPSCATNTAPANSSTAIPQNVTLTWSAAANATSYDLYLGTVNPPTTLVAAGLTATTYSATNLNLNTTYFWYALPKNSLGSGSCSATATQFTTGVLPLCPTLIAPANNATGISASTTLTWAAVSNATKYDVFLGTTNLPTIKVATDITVTTFAATGLVNNTVYYWYVVPKNSFGASTTCGTAFSFSTSTPAPAFCKGINGSGLFREIYNNIPGSNLSDLYANANYPNNPSSTSIITSSLSAVNAADNYGDRLRGYLTVGTTGTYFFTVTGDDQTELYLSTSNNPANRAKIAFINGWTNVAEFAKFPTQKSVGITLTANVDYYIELLHKEGGGGDHWGMYWQTPGSTAIIEIPVNSFSPITTNCSPVATCNGGLIENGSFESGFKKAWNSNGIISTTTDVKSGFRSAQVCNVDGGFGFNTNIVAGATYTFTASAKISGAPGCAQLGFQFLDFNYNVIAGQDFTLPITATTFTNGSFTKVAPVNAVYAATYAWKCGTTGCLFADDFCLTASNVPAPTCTGNVLANGGFENNLIGTQWTNNAVITTTASEIAAGTKAVRVCGNEGGMAFRPQAIPGATYIFKVLSKVSGNPDCAGVGLQFMDANHVVIPNNDFWVEITSSVYSQVNITRVAPANAAFVNTYIWKCGATGCQFADEFCLSVSNVPTCNKTALFVVGNTTLGAGDQVVFNRLQALGLTVTTRSDVASTTADASGKGLVVISSTTNSVNVNTKFTNVNVPVICYESRLYDDLKMTATLDGTDYATYGLDYGTPTVYQVNMLAPQHPIGGNLSGWRSVYFSNSFMQWGKPGAGATKIAEIPNQPGKNPIFCYETGAAMVGLNAPARRVGMFLYDLTPTALTVDGFKLFDNSVKWAMNCSSLFNLYVAPQAELVFNAFKKPGAVELKWISRTGERNEDFIIERSFDNSNWAAISSKIDGRGGADENLYFQEYDESPVVGANYYRLRLTMTDGSELVSNTQLIDFQSLTPFEVFPNPAQEKIFVNLKPVLGEPVTLRLFDQRGIQSAEWKVDEATAEPLELSVEGRANGQYILWIFTENHRPEARNVMIVNE